MKLAPYPEYKDSGQPFLGKIPAHWELFRNGRLFSQRNETGFGELPILEVSLKTGVRVRDMDNLKRKQVMSDREKYKRAVQGDIAYNMMRMWQGAVGVAPVDGLVSPAYVVVRPFPEVDCRYFSYLFRTASYMNEVDAYSRGIVKDRNRLYWQDFKSMPSPVPSFDEQQQITRFLDVIGAKTQRFIRNKRRLIELLKEQKQNVISQAVTRGLDPKVKLKPSGIEWVGDIPKHWEYRYFFQSFREKQVKNGGLIEVNRLSLSYGKIIRKSIDATDGLLPLSFETYQIVEQGDIILRLTDLQNDHKSLRVGRVEERGIITSAYLCIYTLPKIISEFAYLLLHTYDLRKIFYGMGGGVRQSIGFTELKRWPFPVPPASEQGEIVGFIKEETKAIDDTITRAEREIELMREYRTRLISSVVTGQVDVRGIKVPEISEDELLTVDEDTSESDDMINDELEAGLEE